MADLPARFAELAFWVASSERLIRERAPSAVCVCPTHRGTSAGYRACINDLAALTGECWDYHNWRLVVYLQYFYTLIRAIPANSEYYHFVSEDGKHLIIPTGLLSGDHYIYGVFEHNSTASAVIYRCPPRWKFAGWKTTPELLADPVCSSQRLPCTPRFYATACDLMFMTTAPVKIDVSEMDVSALFKFETAYARNSEQILRDAKSAVVVVANNPRSAVPCMRMHPHMNALVAAIYVPMVARYDTRTVTVALALQWVGDSYKAIAVDSLSAAYNNARVVLPVDAPWIRLRPAKSARDTDDVCVGDLYRVEGLKAWEEMRDEKKREEAKRRVREAHNTPWGYLSAYPSIWTPVA